jgi:hypothetical protein
MIFKLAEAAERSWRRLDGHNQLPKLIVGVKFTDGIEVVRSKDQAAAARSLPSPKFGGTSLPARPEGMEPGGMWRYAISRLLAPGLLLDLMDESCVPNASLA